MDENTSPPASVNASPASQPDKGGPPVDDKPWQFKKGNPGYRMRRGKAKDKGKKRPPKLLRDMRWVYGHDESKDKTPGQRALRKLLVDDPKEFFSRMTALEREYLAAISKKRRASAKEEEPLEEEEEDDGSRRLGELLEAQLAQARAEQAEEDAELGARLNAAETGRARQEELRTTLCRERYLREEVAELESNVVEPEQDAGMRELFYEFYAEQAKKDDELAGRPNPAAIIGSLQKALDSTLRREGLLREKLAQLQGSGPAELSPQPSSQ